MVLNMSEWLRNEDDVAILHVSEEPVPVLKTPQSLVEQAGLPEGVTGDEKR